MTLAIQTEAPPLRTDPDGTIRVGKSGVILDLVIQAFRDGEAPACIVEHFPTVTLADVHGVIAYYLRHREDVDAYLAERERTADELQKQIEVEFGSQDGLRQRLLERLKNQST